MSIGHALATTMVNAPGTPASPFEPSGTWFAKVGNDISYSKDGKNWATQAFGFVNTSYQQDVDASGDLLFIGVNGSSSSLKSNNKAIPSWSGDISGLANTQWVCRGPGSWNARTTIQLRTSADGITWTDNDASIPANWSSISGGQHRYSPTAGLYISCGSTFSIGFLDQYFTSANGLSWTQRTFPTNWTANGQTGVDWFIDNGSIALMALEDGRIYSTTDCINWTLRFTAGTFLIGICWNPILGAFYASIFAANPNNLIRSTDGITWTAVAGNDLDSLLNSGQIMCDPVTGLMLCNTTSSTASSFQTTDCAVTTDGVNWFPRWARSGRWLQHVPGKYGPDISDVLAITPDPINVTEIKAVVDAFARLISRSDNTIDQQTQDGGIAQIGQWSVEGLNGLNPNGREVRLDQLTGDPLNFGTATLNAWVSPGSDRIWGYRVQTDPGILEGTFNLRYRDKITLVESNTVPVTLKAEVTAPALVQLGDHSLRMGIEATSGTRALTVKFRGAAFGFFEFAVLTFESAGLDIIIEMDGVEVVNQNGTGRPWTILGTPIDAQVIQNSSIVGLRVGYPDEWTSDSLGFGGSNYVGETYDWRWTLISGTAPQSVGNATDGVWFSILNATEGSWAWDGTPPPAFTSVFKVDIRDGTATIVATGTFTIERYVIP